MRDLLQTFERILMHENFRFNRLMRNSREIHSWRK